MPAGGGRSGKHSPGSARHATPEPSKYRSAPRPTRADEDAAQGQEIIPNGSVLRPQDLAICPG